MLHKYFTGVIISSLLLAACGGSKHSGKSADVMPGTWQAQPVIVDGDSKDWPSPYPNYDAKSLVAYATSNDKDNLYITMETGDELTQLKILKQGMTVLIDTNGRKDGQLSITYPLQNDNDPLDMSTEDNGIRRDRQHGQSRWEKKIAKSAEQATQYSLEGFNNCNGGYAISQTTACGIKVKLRIDEYKDLVWEAKIPFKAIYNKEVITAAQAGKPISVCFSVKAFKNPAAKSHDNPTGGAGGTNNNMGGGMGSNSGMGRSGATIGRPNENPMQHLYESTKTWKQFGLAWQQ